MSFHEQTNKLSNNTEMNPAIKFVDDFSQDLDLGLISEILAHFKNTAGNCKFLDFLNQKENIIKYFRNGYSYFSGSEYLETLIVYISWNITTLVEKLQLIVAQELFQQQLNFPEQAFLIKKEVQKEWGHEKFTEYILSHERKETFLFFMMLASVDDQFIQLGSNAAQILVKNGVAFDGFDFKNLRLQNSNLSNATFKNTCLQGCIFTQVSLEGASFCEVDLSNSIFKAVNISGANFNGVDLTGCNWTHTRLIQEGRFYMSNYDFHCEMILIDGGRYLCVCKPEHFSQVIDLNTMKVIFQGKSYYLGKPVLISNFLMVTSEGYLHDLRVKKSIKKLKQIITAGEHHLLVKESKTKGQIFDLKKQQNVKEVEISDSFLFVQLSPKASYLAYIHNWSHSKCAGSLKLLKLKEDSYINFDRLEFVIQPKFSLDEELVVGCSRDCVYIFLSSNGLLINSIPQQQDSNPKFIDFFDFNQQILFQYHSKNIALQKKDGFQLWDLRSSSINFEILTLDQEQIFLTRDSQYVFSVNKTTKCIHKLYVQGLDVNPFDQTPKITEIKYQGTVSDAFLAKSIFHGNNRAPRLILGKKQVANHKKIDLNNWIIQAMNVRLQNSRILDESGRNLQKNFINTHTCSKQVSDFSDFFSPSKINI